MLTVLQKISCCICFLSLSITSCSSKTLDLVNIENRNRTEAKSTSSEEKLDYLDLDNPTVVQPIDVNDKAIEEYKFVEVDVAEVVNPKKHQVAFQVHYQTSANEKVYLGSFGLFPADNPGKFIVSTRGKVKNAGAIVLSLVKPEKISPTDKIRVGIKGIKLIKGN